MNPKEQPKQTITVATNLLSNEQKQAIVDQLNSRVPDLKCPICRSDRFIVVDGYMRNTLHKSSSEVRLGGVALPTAAICCKNCGFVSQHALGILGLLEKKDSPKPGEKEAAAANAEVQK